MLYDNQGSYEPDMAELIDQEHEILAEKLNIHPSLALRICKHIDEIVEQRVSTEVAFKFGVAISHIWNEKNKVATLAGYLFALGLDQLNGIKTQTEVAKALGCTRALISHYTNGAKDLLSNGPSKIDIRKYCKRNETRATYAEQAKSPFIAAKMKARKKYKQQDK